MPNTTDWSVGVEQLRVVWEELFHLAGYTVNGAPAARPTGSMRLWRGALP